MSSMDETEALRAEVAELRAEVERLRLQQAGHVCYDPSSPYAQWYRTTAAAAPCPPPVLTLAPGMPVWKVAFPAAGCAGGGVMGQQFYMVNAGA